MARISQIELARKLNVNRSSVSRAVKNGRLTVGNDGLLDEDEARRQWYATQSPLPHHQANRARLDDLQTVKAQPETMGLSGPDLGAAEKIGLRLKLATMKEREAKAEQANLDLDRAAKAVIDFPEVAYAFQHMGRVFAEKIGSLADRYTATVAANKGDIPGTHKSLDDASAEIQNEVADEFKLTADKLFGQ